jgi:hypothetical protein
MRQHRSLTYRLFVLRLLQGPAGPDHSRQVTACGFADIERVIILAVLL